MEKKELTQEQLLARRAYHANYRAQHREKYNAKQNEFTKQWYQRNKEEVKAKKRVFYQENREEILAKAKERREAQKQKE